MIPDPLEQLRGRLRTYLLLRLVVISAMFGLATYLLFRMKMDVQVLAWIYPLFIVIYGATALFARRLPRIVDLSFFSYSQFLLDVISITVVVAFTGFAESLYAYFYFFVILASGLILLTRGALVVATMASVCYLAVIGLRLVGFEALAIQGLGGGVADDPGTFFRVSQITVQVMGFYLLAWLSGTLSARLQESQVALRRAGVDLAALQDLHASIIDNIGNGILTVDADGRITSFNRAAIRITGIPAATACSQTLDQIFPGSMARMTFADAPVDATGSGNWITDSHGWEDDVRLPDGTDKRLRFAVSPLRDRSGVQVGNVLLFEDRTRLRAMEQRLKRSRHMAEVGKLSAGILHEIRNPLAAISGSAQLLGSESSVTEQDGRLLQIIVREADRLNGLVSNFLGVARSRPLERVPVQLDRCIAETIEALRVNGHAHTGLDIEESYDFRPLVRADPDRIRQVFWNLFNNAFEAMPNGGTLSVRTERIASESNRDW